MIEMLWFPNLRLILEPKVNWLCYGKGILRNGMNKYNFNLYIIKTMDWTFASQSTIIAVHKDNSLAIPFFMLISLLHARGVEYL